MRNNSSNNFKYINNKTNETNKNKNKLINATNYDIHKIGKKVLHYMDVTKSVNDSMINLNNNYSKLSY